LMKHRFTGTYTTWIYHDESENTSETVELETVASGKATNEDLTIEFDKVVLVVVTVLYPGCKVLNTIVWRMAHHNPFDSLQSSGDNSNTPDTGNNPGDVKASPALEFVPGEDWVMFIDYCNSKKLLVYVYVIRIYPCTKERGITDEKIGKIEVYIPAHTKKDTTIQCPDVIAKLQNIIRKDPKSIRTGPNDAIAQAVSQTDNLPS
ncbi:hypothetical protein GIB67_031435, partial [Kingdonia uniflora]